MKAAQITRYSKNIRMTLNDIPVPESEDDESLSRGGQPGGYSQPDRGRPADTGLQNAPDPWK